MMKRTDKSDKAGLLIVLLVSSAIGIIGWNLPTPRPVCTTPASGFSGTGVSNNPSKVQCANTQIVILAGQSTGSATITFNPSFTVRPFITYHVDSSTLTTVTFESQMSFLSGTNTTTPITSTVTTLFNHTAFRGIFESFAAAPAFVQLQVDVVSTAGSTTNSGILWVQALDCNVDGLGGSAFESLGNLANSPRDTINAGATYYVSPQTALNATLWNDIINNSCMFGGQPEFQFRVVGQTTTGTAKLKIDAVTLSLFYSSPEGFVAVDLLPDNPPVTSVTFEVIGFPGTYVIGWTARV